METPIYPFLLMTVHRRYFELIANLKRYHLLKNEFQETPTVVLVWADPIKCDEWIFNFLVDKGYVDNLLYRPFLVKDQYINTTYPESMNINIGLKFIKNLSLSRGNPAYCFMQAHDIFVYENTYAELDAHMQSWAKGVLFDWVHSPCYSTNIFAIRMDESEALWPPVASPLIYDGLELLWYNKLGKDPRGIKVYKDSNRLFSHLNNYGEAVKWLRKHKLKLETKEK